MRKWGFSPGQVSSVQQCLLREVPENSDYGWHVARRYRCSMTWASLFWCHVHQAAVTSPLGVLEGMLKGESYLIVTHPFSATVHFKWVIGHSGLYTYIHGMKAWDWLCSNRTDVSACKAENSPWSPCYLATWTFGFPLGVPFCCLIQDAVIWSHCGRSLHVTHHINRIK